jgi:hypothetical protein
LTPVEVFGCPTATNFTLPKKGILVVPETMTVRVTPGGPRREVCAEATEVDRSHTPTTAKVHRRTLARADVVTMVSSSNRRVKIECAGGHGTARAGPVLNLLN